MSPAIPARMLAASGAIATALVTAVPAQAQQMGYEGQVYQYPQLQYSQPQYSQPVQQPVYVRQPVVQQLPQQDYQTYETGYDAYRDYDNRGPSDVEYYRAQSGYPEYQGQSVQYTQPGYAEPSYQQQYTRPAPPPPYPGYPHYQGYPQQGYAGPPQGGYGYQQQASYPPMPPVVDRDGWIADCRAYLKERRRRADGGAVAGGLLGAAAGGVIGNRVADGERLGGTLIGAGVGGLVGLFIGQAIALGKGDGIKRDCKNWLKTYEQSYAGGGRWPAQGYYPYPGPMWGGWDGRWQQSGAWQSGWSSSSWGGWWSGGYVVVPQTTVIITQSAPMVPVVREIVREEWVEEEVTTYRKVTPPPAPKPKVRYIKTRPAPKPIKYIKGK